VASVYCSWQGIDRSLVASARVVKYIYYNFIITTFDCQGGGISAGAFSLTHPGVALPLSENSKQRWTPVVELPLQPQRTPERREMDSV